jgi:hypothetical protein
VEAAPGRAPGRDGAALSRARRRPAVPTAGTVAGTPACAATPPARP